MAKIHKIHIHKNIEFLCFTMILIEQNQFNKGDMIKNDIENQGG